MSSGDPRLGTPAPSGIVLALAVTIAFYVAGPVAAIVVGVVLVAAGVAWFVRRQRGR